MYRQGRPSFKIALFILVGLAVVVMLSSIAYVSPPRRLEIKIVPDAIPAAGEWTVTSFLSKDNISSSVESNVTMLATIDTGNMVEETKPTSQGEATFRAVPNTIAVTFEAEHVEYYLVPSGNGTDIQRERFTASHKISGPQMLSSEQAILWISLAVPCAVAYLGWTAKQLRDERVPAILRFSIILSALVGIVPIVGYVVFDVPRWLPTGYYPLHWLGVLPIYWMFLIPALMLCISFPVVIWYQRKEAPKHSVPSDALL